MFLCRRIFSSLGSIPGNGIAFNHKTVLQAAAPYFIPTSDVWGCQGCHILVNTCCYLSDDTHPSCPGVMKYQLIVALICISLMAVTLSVLLCAYSLALILVTSSYKLMIATHVLTCVVSVLSPEAGNSLETCLLPYRVEGRKKHQSLGKYVRRKCGQRAGILGRKGSILLLIPEKKVMEMVLISGEQLGFRHWTKSGE